jgi:uncharacterized protein (TIGR00369 family)
MKPLPEHGPCFVCGTENPQSMGCRWFVRDNGSIYGQATLTLAQQGPPRHVHGGASAALIDEAMGTAVWYAGYTAAAVNLNVDFRRPVPLGVLLHITAAITAQDGRKVYAQGEIRLPDGQIAVTGKGIFVEAEHLFVPFAEEYAKFLDVRGEKVDNHT